MTFFVRRIYSDSVGPPPLPPPKDPQDQCSGAGPCFDRLRLLKSLGSCSQNWVKFIRIYTLNVFQNFSYLHSKRVSTFFVFTLEAFGSISTNWESRLRLQSPAPQHCSRLVKTYQIRSWTKTSRTWQGESESEPSPHNFKGSDNPGGILLSTSQSAGI